MNRREWERKQRRASREEWKRLYLSLGVLFLSVSVLALLLTISRHRLGEAKAPLICIFLFSGLFLLPGIVMHFRTPPDEEPPASPSAVKEQVQDAYEDVKYRRRDAEERRRKKVLGRLTWMNVVFFGCAILGWAFHSSVTFYVFIALVAVLALYGKLYYDRLAFEWADEDARGPVEEAFEGADPADQERYDAARETLINLLRNRGGVDTRLANNFIKWAENRSQRFRDDLHRLPTFAAEFSAEYRFSPEETQALLEVLLARARRPPDVPRQGDTYIDIVVTSKGAVVVTWRPATPDVEQSLRVARERAKQPITQAMTQILQANPETDLAKKALTFGVEVMEVERSWTEGKDTLRLAKDAANEATSLMQIAVAEAEFMAAHNLKEGTPEYYDVQAIFEKARNAIKSPNRV